MSDTGLTAEQFIRLVVNLFRDSPDDHVVSLGDWSEPVAEGRRPVFCPIVRVTVGDFRRWDRDARGRRQVGEGGMSAWRPLADLPERRAMHVNVRTPDGSVTSYRWLPYKRGAGSPWEGLGGRWQSATEHGWRNADMPKAGEWTPSPVRRTA